MADAFDVAAHAGRAALTPRPSSRPRCATAIAAELDLLPTISTPERTSTMSDDTMNNDTRHRTTTVVPYLCAHDAAGALDWYAPCVRRRRDDARWTDEQNRVGHAEFVIGGAGFFLSDEHPEIGVLSPRTLGGTPSRCTCG